MPSLRETSTGGGPCIGRATVHDAATVRGPDARKAGAMADRWPPSSAFLWPALAAASASEMAALFAEQFAQLAVDTPAAPAAVEAAPPAWTSRNRVTLELPTMRVARPPRPRERPECRR